MSSKLLIVGAGLIGTSIALRARELTWEVELQDRNERALQLAYDLIGFKGKVENPDLVVIATTPNSIASLVFELAKKYPEATLLDVASTKAKTQAEIDRFPDIAKRFIGTHPIAGRERGGPQSARSDLFVGRAWVVTPSIAVEPRRFDLVGEFIEAMGAARYEMSTKLHDALFAKISHLPQILSVILASSISEMGPEVSLAGQGLRDMLRISSSDGALWSEILLENQEEILESIDDFQGLLDGLRDALEDSDKAKIIEIFEDVRHIAAKVGGKHGAKPREYTFIDVVIDDRPGQLAAIFAECGDIGVNVEDLALEHSPRQETGLIRLALSKSDAGKLFDHLANRGWKVHQQ
ncbi:MAG: prephenate dehydrogenase/arogenate dehydrogenase family protein [Actinomycetota bacterium]|jgi:prephenate dehydrogenase